MRAPWTSYKLPLRFRENFAGKPPRIDHLLVDFAHSQGAQVIIRGLRAISDFDYEFQMASMNAHIDPEIETVCLMASDKHQFIASRLVKEIAKLKGDVSKFVTSNVLTALELKLHSDRN